jgi:anti-sigma-K factor RskA
VNNHEHRQVEELLAAYADGGLVGEEAKTVERHVADCAACRDEVRALRVVLGAAARVDSGPAPSEAFWNGMAREVRVAYDAAETARRRTVLGRVRAFLTGPRLFVAGACAAVVLVAVLLTTRGQESGIPTPAPTEIARPEAIPLPATTDTEDMDDEDQLAAVLDALEPAAPEGDGEERADDAELVGASAADEAIQDLDDAELERVLAALSRKGV